MHIRRLHTRFVLAGALLVLATVGSSAWSAWMFARLSAVVNDTLRDSQRTIDRTTALAGSLEREDDALLLALSGNVEAARKLLEAERQAGDEQYRQLAASLGERYAERGWLARLRQEMDAYRRAGSGLIDSVKDPAALQRYHQQVNPLLRQAVATCAQIREENSREMRRAAVRARDEAGQATWVVIAVSLVAMLSASVVALWLARSILVPIGELTASVEALRRGDFDQRVRPAATDELDQLATGFNRMAEALAEYRRSSLGELLAAKNTLEATLNALPDAVLVFGPGGALVASNPPARTILAAGPRGEARQVADLPFSEDQRGAIETALAGKAAPTGPPDFGKALTVVLGGEPRRFLLSAVPVPRFTVGGFGAVVVLHDVTEFARLDEMRTDLIGVASHELKSPLTTVRMSLLMLGEESSGMSPRQQQLVAAAVQGCEELGLTIEELLDVTRIEAGQLRLNLAPLDLGTVLTTTRQAVQTRFTDAGVRLVLEENQAPVIVRGDAARLASVFANVLTNALKYSPIGGVVTVRLSSGGQVPNEAAVTITDQGPGVPEDYRERIFEKFFRVEDHLGRSGKGVRGTGIGLYLCRQIVKAHGGTITCQAGEGGTGTRIVVSLPTAG